MRFVLTVFVFFSFITFASADSLKPFIADYNVYYGDFKLGEGEYQLKQLQTDIYNFRFNSQLRFLFISDKRNVDVDFRFQDNQVLPMRYTHRRSGSGSDYTDIVIYDKANNNINSEHKGEIYEQEYDSLIRDALSAQLQLMLDLKRGIKTPSYKILEQNRVKERFFEFLQEETLLINGKNYRCVVYQIVRSKKKRRTKMWFSIDHNYQPVRMVHFDKNKKKFNAELAFFQFN